MQEYFRSLTLLVPWRCVSPRGVPAPRQRNTHLAHTASDMVGSRQSASTAPSTASSALLVHNPLGPSRLLKVRTAPSEVPTAAALAERTMWLTRLPDRSATCRGRGRKGGSVAKSEERGLR